jgi:3-oxoacyl-[acyl-carrier protein] reductase
MKMLEGKNVILTGGSRGIGKGIAIEFAKSGANVAFTYSSSEAPAKELENMLCTEYGVQAFAYKSNAAVFEDCEQLVKDVLSNFDSIDVLINNAGITKDNLLMRMSESDFDDVIDVNLKSVFNMTKAVQRTMLKQRNGSIINISSVVGVKGNAGQANYAASKAGIIGFTKSIALELGSRNIRSNVIAPGFIETEMTSKLDESVVDQWRQGIPLKRGGTTEDIANACLFFASEMSSYITGQVLLVDGGMLT